MSFNVLLKKDWKQVSLLWFLLILLSVVAFTVPTWSQMQYFDEEIRNIKQAPSDYSLAVSKEEVAQFETEDFFSNIPGMDYSIGDLYSLMPYGGVIFLYLIFSALIASVLIGSERNSQMSDFALSLPFTRSQLYISKWMLGASGFIVSTLLGGAAFVLLVKTSKYAFLMDGKHRVVIAVLVFLMLFGLAAFAAAMWMGSFGGEAISQVIWTVLILVLPSGLIGLTQFSIETVFGTTVEFLRTLNESILLRLMSPLGNLINIDIFEVFRLGNAWEDFYTVVPLTLLGYIVLAFVLGMYAFNRAPQENNGRFVMFSGWVKFIHGLAIISVGMFGGLIFSTFSYPTNVFLYVIGFAIGALLAHLVAKRLLYRFNLQLKA